MKLEGKAFIITGGAGSIGGAAARNIIAEGGIAVIFDILSPEDGDKKAKEYHPERAFYFQTDITDADKVSAACDAALVAIPKGSLFGGVHCAAIAPGRKWDHKLKNSIPFFQKVMHVNSFGTFVVDSCIADAINSQYPDEGPFGPRVTEERGCIVNITSVVANPVPARCICYGTSKTAVLGISQGMADFLGPYGIRVNCVSPAVVASALQTAERRPYFLAEMEALCLYPRRLSEAEEVADAILFVLKNSMMNDAVIKVDGGWRNMSTWGGAADPRSNAISLE